MGVAVDKFSSIKALNKAVLDEIISIDNSSQKGKTILLPGGTTPRSLFKEMSKTKHKWNNTNFYPTDERLVPLDDPNSNYGQIKENFDKSPTLKKRLHPLTNEDGSINIDKLLLHKTIDLAILGIGLDGHFASIFPENQIKMSKQIIAKPLEFEEVESHIAVSRRITFTFNTLKSSKKIIVIARGREKEKIFESREKHPTLPINRLLAVRPDTKFYWTE